ncbi:hypothetical protein PR003_g2057 [Phytophthora rubi]|uniref:Uncharacterized protein n=1 Tax=Phytophthora rubi TaxID=129364 RepID=A0A6A3P2E7_9STRA|nr:hypothetical protein PR002_g3163 [Phytophthora rubi]KAE9049587.1 hypothetical protein PR001_g3176 [Phytophthora rubi]KAE9356940.1 hypothetical protein PR003_g2057 [Phytophthora rubi]
MTAVGRSWPPAPFRWCVVCRRGTALCCTAHALAISHRVLGRGTPAVLVQHLSRISYELALLLGCLTHMGL